MSVWSRKRKRVVEEGELDDDDEQLVVQRPEKKAKRPSGEKKRDESAEQRARRRQRRKLYRRIREQMEFYFSEANLSKDKYLMEVMNGNSVAWVKLQEFLDFNKIKSLTSNVKDIRKAISHSKIVEVSPNEECVRRRSAIEPKENVDSCTIYVEGVPSCADVDWIRQLFGEWGTVVYVSMPRFRSSGRCKGFAFVEFETNEQANLVLQVFAEVGCVRDSESSDAPAPLSFTMHDQDQDLRIVDEEKEKEVMKKTLMLNDGSDSESEAKRAALLGLEEGEVLHDDGDKKKKKKKHKKKKNSSEKTILDIGGIGLTLLSKKNWKALRNKCLSLERKNAARLKDHLQSLPTPPQSSFDAVPTPKKASEVVPVPRSDEYEQLSWKDREKLDVWRRLNYRSGIIVKVFTEIDSEDSLRIIRNLINSVITPEQVDVQPDQDLCYIRCRNAMDAKKLASSASFTSSGLLTGVEEAAYWQELFDRKLKKLRKERSKQASRAERLQNEAGRQEANTPAVADATPTAGDATASPAVLSSPLTPAGTSTGCDVPGLDDLSESEEEEGAIPS